ncbi:MAG TPA: PilZ domain-containing protein [bacterium]|nr:PilZ domain-containing protein [bacterium]
MDKKGKLFVERRAHKRVEKEYEILYKLMPKEVAETREKKGGMSRDISIGGARVKGEPEGNEGDVLRIEIAAENKNSPIVLFAEIRWIDAPNNLFGVQFLALREEDRELIQKITEG